MIIKNQYDLQAHNSFGVKATAGLYILIESARDYMVLPDVLESRGNGSSPLILGGGSNILFTKDPDGPVIHPKTQAVQVIRQTPNEVILEADAGVEWDRLVDFTVTQGWGGLENLSLIPGSTGAAPIQNIGAYGVEAGNHISGVRVFDLQTAGSAFLTREECGFGYRQSVFKSIFKGRFIIQSVEFSLETKPVLETSYGQIAEELRMTGESGVSGVRNAVIRIRKRKLPDPKDLGNAGSFFKNPVVDSSEFSSLKKDFPLIPFFPDKDGRVKIPAGWLIEHSGLKGWKNGRVGTYPLQALILVNLGGATGLEILDTAKLIQARVKMNFGIDLEMEVNVI